MLSNTKFDGSASVLDVDAPGAGLISGFLRSAERFGSHNALVVNGEAVTYAGLQAAASRIAGAITAT